MADSNLRARISDLSGEKVSGSIASTLEDWLLPGEPLLAAVQGKAALNHFGPAWFFLTESVLLYVVDAALTWVYECPVGLVTAAKTAPLQSSITVDSMVGPWMLAAVPASKATSFVDVLNVVRGGGEDPLPRSDRIIGDALGDLGAAAYAKLIVDPKVKAFFGAKTPLVIALEELMSQVLSALGPRIMPAAELQRQEYPLFLLLWYHGIATAQAGPLAKGMQRLKRGRSEQSTLKRLADALVLQELTRRRVVFACVRGNDQGISPLLTVHEHLGMPVHPLWAGALEAAAVAVERAADLISYEPSKDYLAQSAERYRMRISEGFSSGHLAVSDVVTTSVATSAPSGALTSTQ